MYLWCIDTWWLSHLTNHGLLQKSKAPRLREQSEGLKKQVGKHLSSYSMKKKRVKVVESGQVVGLAHVLLELLKAVLSGVVRAVVTEWLHRH